MTITDLLAAYGALLATGLGAWDITKYLLDRPRLKVLCYVAKMVDPALGTSSSDLLAYRVANTGGKPIVVNTLGGAYRTGRQFMLVPTTITLPRTLQPGESVTVPGPLPADLRDITHFWVSDGLGKEWRVSTKTAMKQLAARLPPGS